MNYQMISHEYYNTGGSCMVSSFELYDEDEHRMLYALVRDDRGQLATADYVKWDVTFKDDMIIEEFSIDSLNESDDNFELYRYCINEHAKKDCQHFSTTIRLPWHVMSDHLKSQVPIGYVDWHYANYADDIQTDGHRVILESDYNQPEKVEVDLQLSKVRQLLVQVNAELMDMLDDKASTDMNNDKLIIVGFGHRFLVLERNLATLTGLQGMLEYIANN